MIFDSFEAMVMAIPVLILYFFNGLTFYQFFLNVLFCSLMSLGIFFLNIIHPDLNEMAFGPFVTIAGFQIQLSVIKQAFYYFLRLFLLSLISLSCGKILDLNQLVLYLMQVHHLSVKIGYSLIISLNSIGQLKKEFTRIMINLKLKGIPFRKRIYFMVPLIVFAFRYSERASLSLVTRGVNAEKTFFYHYQLEAKDRKILIVFFIIYFCYLLKLIYFL